MRSSALPALGAHRPGAYDLRRGEPAARCSDATRLLAQMGRSSANAYVFAVQERLAQRGMFTGQPNGIVNGATVDAIQAVCEQAKMSDKCSTGPLSPDAIDIVSKFVTSST